MFVCTPRLERGEQDSVGKSCDAAADDEDPVPGESRQDARENVENAEGNCSLASAQARGDEVSSWEESSTWDESADVYDSYLSLHESMVVIETIEVRTWRQWKEQDKEQQEKETA